MTVEDLFPHAEVVTSAIGPDVAERLRAGITDYERYALLDRGSYEVAPVRDPELLHRVCGLGARRLGRELVAIEGRALRLRAGDYLLARHDRATGVAGDRRATGVAGDRHATRVAGDRRVHDGRPVELVLDLSPHAGSSEIQYRRLGQVFFTVPNVPRSLAIVERTPVITCNHTYVSKRALGVEVVRLVVLASYTSSR